MIFLPRLALMKNSFSTGEAVCDHCKPKVNQIYLKQLHQFNDMEARFSRLWTQCQR